MSEKPEHPKTTTTDAPDNALECPVGLHTFDTAELILASGYVDQPDLLSLQEQFSTLPVQQVEEVINQRMTDYSQMDEGKQGEMLPKLINIAAIYATRLGFGPKTPGWHFVALRYQRQEGGHVLRPFQFHHSSDDSRIGFDDLQTAIVNFMNRDLADQPDWSEANETPLK